MAIVCKPDGQKVILYDFPDDQLDQFKLSPEKVGEMFPMKEDRIKDDATAVAKAWAADGDVQAYGEHEICYTWECDGYGNCVYTYWHC